MNDSLVRVLDPSFYSSREIFEKEINTIFSTTWHFAGHTSQLSNTGDYFTFELFGENFFSVMGGDGQIRTFYNVCQHRAHPVVSGCGTISKLTCPYHAWTYDLEGILQFGPNLKSVPGLECSTIRLTEVRTEIFLNFIFVNLDPDSKPMDQWFPGVCDELKEFLPRWKDLAPAQWIEVEENCNWKVSVENYSECYHCALNHPSFSTGVIKPNTYDIQPQGYCLRHTTEARSVKSMSYAIDASVPHANEYSSWYLWPMFSFQVYPGQVLNTYHWRPIDAEHVTVYRGWFSANGDHDETVSQLAVQDRATTVAEDIRLVESVQRGLKSRGYSPGPLVIDPNFGVNSEHSLAAFHNWVREGMKESETADQ